MKKHVILKIEPGSIAEELEIEAGDELVEVNGQPIEDIFDFQFLCMDEYLEVLIRKPDGEEWLLEIDKEADEDLGLVFDDGLMDECRSCRNRCIFCFIDQMPRGMRKTLYFKDDDTRLSFLQGNYVTLTNLSDHDIERIIRYRMEPINISIQTMNPALRVEMLKNPKAGESLKRLDELFEAGIQMNGQIVLCKGVNDGEELRYSIEQMMKYLPLLQSVSVVPVGLTKYRDKLYPLQPFEKADAEAVIDLIESYQQKAYAEHGLHFIHASDEWYLTAERTLPEEARYDGYLQLENGVGMLRLLTEEVRQAIPEYAAQNGTAQSGRVCIATGKSAYATIRTLADAVVQTFPGIEAEVRMIRNDFFGERITVSGLITGQDLVAQLQGTDLGEAVLIPQNMLRAGEEVFLDDMTLSEVRDALQRPVVVVKSSGMDFVRAVVSQRA
ncbi:MAG: DUF512 domain-containing protein [Lachnospiraceae bacterium]|nr:DUF512 domain-containing protein [Lachnospiraceae bacterium]